MDGIEQAIRRALAKGNADDRSFREKVYRSAFAALDKSLKERRNLTVENAIKARKTLQALVRSIETEYVPALPPEPIAVEPSMPRPVQRSVRELSAEPELRAERQEPAANSYPRLDLDVPPRPPRPVKLEKSHPPRDKRRRSGRIVSLVAGLIILTVVGTGLWWTYANFGHLLGSDIRELEAALNEQRGQSGPPPLSADGIDPDAGWTNVFRPEDIQLVSPPEDASAEVTEDEGGPFLRIRSGPSGAPVAFSIGQNLLERFSGERVAFNIVARGIEGEQTQMSVECDFGALGECGRTRYSVGAARDNYLLVVELANASLGRSGAIAINTDVAGEGRGLEILNIRMRPAE